jgi:hypothetical protein
VRFIEEIDGSPRQVMKPSEMSQEHPDMGIRSLRTEILFA